MKRTCLWAITSHDIISCCRWNLERYDNVVNFPNPLASESFPNPLAFESDAESLSCYNVSLISLHTFMGSIQTIKTSVLQELQKYRLTVQLYLPESRRQYWRGQIWNSNFFLFRSSSTMGHESLNQRRLSLSHPGWLKYFYSKLPYT